MLSDRPREECGIFGIYAPGEDVAQLTFFGLHALQHRGQEAAGIAVTDGTRIRLHKGVGLVSSVLTPEILESLSGRFAIGHTRYSTLGGSSLLNAQPYLVETIHGQLAVAHNGNLVNAADLRLQLLEQGTGLTSTSDSEVLTMMLAGAPGTSWEERIANAMPAWQGAYSLVVLTTEGVYAVRDPWGFRPLSVGRLPNGAHTVASESGALLTLGVEAIREVKPGEVVRLSSDALRVRQALEPKPNLAYCTFEHIYFSRPDSFWDDLNVHKVRQRLGAELAREAPVPADVVIPVPETSRPAAIGYSRESEIPHHEGLVKNGYVGRTFIQPSDHLRRLGVALKFNTLSENLDGQRVVMIDDSIVRGNTAGPLVKLVRDAGAREVHLRITCPPIAHPCHMGVDMGTHDELIAHRMSVAEIRDQVGADSLHFLSLDGMMRAIGRKSGYCNACFTGDYPIELPGPQLAKLEFEQVIE